MTVETAEDIYKRRLFEFYRPSFQSDERTKQIVQHDITLTEHYQVLIDTWREIADKAWEAGGEYEYRRLFGRVPTEAVNKETFMKQLFPEKV